MRPFGSSISVTFRALPLMLAAALSVGSAMAGEWTVEQTFNVGSIADPAVTFAHRKVQPPSLVYVGPDTVLRFRLMNSVQSANVLVRARLLRPNGDTVRNEWNFQPPNDRSQFAATASVPEGFLLSLVMFVTDGVSRGQLYCVAFLALGGTSTNLQYQELFADYLTSSSPIGWPGARTISSVEGPGALRYITGTLPAANSNISETVPAGARWRLLSLFCTLTYAGAGGKWAWIAFADASGAVIGKYVVTATPTSLGVANAYTFGTGGGSYQGAPPSVQFQVVSLPGGIFVPAGGKITVQTTPGLGGGDQFSAPVYAVEEWIE